MTLNVSEIVITGGPCSGKTTTMAALSAKLDDWGLRILICPEVATIVIAGGVMDIGAIATSDPASFRVIETTMLRFQRSMRQHFRELAAVFVARGERVVILYDRGECDAGAYIGRDLFWAICQEQHLTAADVRDNYDGVIHMVTAAIGAESAYTTANNIARRETPDEAADLDGRTLACWVGHPRLRVIDNSTDFDTKVRRAVGAVAHLVGIPEPLEIERKWRLPSTLDAATLSRIGATAIEIEQHYLISPATNVEIRIRRRGVLGAATYYRTRKERRSDMTRVETQEIISPTEYMTALGDIDPNRGTIRKIRHCFVSGGTYFELDVFEEPDGLVLLEAELGDEAESVVLPDFLSTGAVEVTGDPSYSNAAIATRVTREIVDSKSVGKT